VPPLATRRVRTAFACGLGAAGYLVGLALSTSLDLPSGRVIVPALAVLGLAWYALSVRARVADSHARPQPAESE